VNSINEKIRRLVCERLSKEKIPLYKLGAQIGLRDETLGQLISGNHNPSIKTLIKFCNFFNVSADYMIGLNEKDCEHIEQSVLPDNVTKEIVFICKHCGKELKRKDM
jgi:transcriptional regulator with XRE-family HTH domain